MPYLRAHATILRAVGPSLTPPSRVAYPVVGAYDTRRSLVVPDGDYIGNRQSRVRLGFPVDFGPVPRLIAHVLQAGAPEQVSARSPGLPLAIARCPVVVSRIAVEMPGFLAWLRQIGRES